MTRAPKRGLRGDGLYRSAFGVLASIRAKGLWRTAYAYTNKLLRGISFYVAGFGLVLLKLAWMARQFLHWRLSRKIDQKVYRVRETTCGGCERQVVTQDGRYANRESRYCGSCGCSHNRYSELTVKNTRRGHICPAYKFPEQAEQLKQMEEATKAAAKKLGGCKGCGSKQPTKPTTRNGRGQKLEDWQRNSGLLYARPSMGE